MHQNVFVYGLLSGLALNFASTHQTENLRGFSEVGENQAITYSHCCAFVIFLFLIRLRY
jgi:hypothetical protein